MNDSERHETRGALTIRLVDEAGRPVVHQRIDNLITDAGRDLLANLFGGRHSVREFAIAIGGNGDGPTPADIGLGQKFQEVSAEFRRPTPGEGEEALPALATVTATVPPTSDGDPLPLREAGILVHLNGAETPVLYNRVTFDVIHKSSNMSMTLSWEVTF